MTNKECDTVMDLARIVKGSVQKQGMLGWQYNTIGVRVHPTKFLIYANMCVLRCLMASLWALKVR